MTDTTDEVFNEHVPVTVDRFGGNPLLTPASDDRIGKNINGPSVIRVPDWIEKPLGQYYLYFAHHTGTYIRLAYADDLAGPWEVYSPGTLQIDDTGFNEHIASPDVHVDHDEKRIRMYFHGCCGPFEHNAGTWDQVTAVATSTDGLEFTVREHTLGISYFRVWEYEDQNYAIANDGHLYRSGDPLAPFDRLQELFPRNRHFAVRFLEEDLLQFLLTRRGDRPERVMTAVMDLSGDAEAWQVVPHPPETVLWPEQEYEGGERPLETSSGGSADEPVRAVRDPAVFEEDGRVYLFYAIAGERGIAGGELY